MNRNISNSIRESALSASNTEDNISSSSASNLSGEFYAIGFTDNIESYSLIGQVPRRGQLISNTFPSVSE